MGKSENITKLLSSKKGRVIVHNTLGNLVSGTCDSPEDLIALYRETADQLEFCLKDSKQNKNQLFFSFCGAL
jgi:hypothetical protein